MLAPAPGGKLLTSARYSSPSSWAAAMIARHAAGGSLIGVVVRNPPEPCGSLASPCQFSAFFEIGEHVVPAPAAIAELRPMVEILGLAANVDQPVDRGRAAQNPAARIRDGAAIGAGIGLGFKAPGSSSDGRAIS